MKLVNPIFFVLGDSQLIIHQCCHGYLIKDCNLRRIIDITWNMEPTFCNIGLFHVFIIRKNYSRDGIESNLANKAINLD